MSASDEANHLDPQFRLLLEVTQEALDDAGLLPRSIKGSKTGLNESHYSIVTTDFAEFCNANTNCIVIVVCGDAIFIHDCTQYRRNGHNNCLFDVSFTKVTRRRNSVWFHNVHYFKNPMYISKRYTIINGLHYAEHRIRQIDCYFSDNV